MWPSAPLCVHACCAHSYPSAISRPPATAASALTAPNGTTCGPPPAALRAESSAPCRAESARANWSSDSLRFAAEWPGPHEKPSRCDPRRYRPAALESPANIPPATVARHASPSGKIPICPTARGAYVPAIATACVAVRSAAPLATPPAVPSPPHRNQYGRLPHPAGRASVRATTDPASYLYCCRHLALETSAVPWPISQNFSLKLRPP
jgi:hypothetical protein